jgi:hypothetical protein
MSNDYAVYVLVRNDLPSLNPGKMAAQVHHAGVQMMAKHSKHSLVKSYLKYGKLQGADQFNTTIVLAAGLQDIVKAHTTLTKPMKWLSWCVVDPSYPFMVDNMEIAALIYGNQTLKTHIVKTMDDGRVLMTREELTCAWFLGNRNDEKFKALFTGLSLYP